MGNCQACLSSSLVHDAEEDSVKLVRVTDGQIFEYTGNVFVKDLMFGFEGFAIFHYNTIEQPLPPETELKFNEVYYLRPWTTPEDLSKHPIGGKTVSERKLGCLRSPQQNPVRGDRAEEKKVKFVDDASQENRCEIFALPVSQRGCDSPGLDDRPAALEFLSKQKNSVVRVKLVIPKSQLSDLIAKTEKADAAIERIIAPLLSPKSAAAAQTVGSFSPKSSWKPSLDYIPEDREERWRSLQLERPGSAIQRPSSDES